MKRLVTVLLGICMVASSGAVFAISPSNIVISSIQTESATSASEEYITVHNIGTGLVDVTGWRLQYFSASAATFASPSRTITLSGTLASGAEITVSSTGYNAKASTIFFSPTLSATGGHIRLVSGISPNEVVHDLVGWGTAAHPEQSAADIVARGSAYERAVVNGQPIDTDNNQADFSEPALVGVQTQQPAEPTPAQQQTQQSVVTSYNGLIITELLPDPASPLTDANDEFIELYNDSSSAIDMSGLTLQTGNNNNYSYKLSGTIAAHNYQVLYSSQTKLTLSNSSGRAQIIDSSGNIIDETAAYSAAPTGSSWQLYANEWSWNNTPTPAISNPSPPEGTVTTTKVKSATTTKTAAKAKTTSAKATKETASKSNQQSGGSQNSAAAQPSNINKSVLLGVGILAIGYVIYEYRYDIAQRYRQFRGNRATGQKDSSTP